MRHTRKTARLMLETLEDRCTPAILGWTGAVNGNWSVAANWWNHDLGQVAASAPGVNDVAILDGAGGGLASRDCLVNVNATVGQLRVMDGYGGTVKVHNPLSAFVLQLNGARVTVAGGQELLTSHYEGNGSLISGAGVFRAQAMGELSVALFRSSTSQMDVSMVELGASVVGELREWNHLNSISVASAGLLTWSSGSLTLGMGGVFTNTGTFQALGNTTMMIAGGGKFVNNGVFEKSGFGTTTLGRFENCGAGALVHVKAGEMVLNHISTSSAPFTVEAGSYLAFTGPLATANFAAGAEVDGGGMVTFTDGAQATVAAGATMKVYTAMGLAGGSTMFNAQAGKLEVWGSLTWAGGGLEGVVDLNGTTTLSNNNSRKVVDPGLLRNFGVLIVDGTFPLELNGSTLENHGTINFVSTAGIIDGIQVPGTFKNMLTAQGPATVIKTAGEATSIAVRFENHGLLNANGRQINFQNHNVGQLGPGAITMLKGGTLTVQLGFQFDLNGGTFIGDSGAAAGSFTGKLANVGGTVVVGSNQDRMVFKVVGEYEQGVNGSLVIMAYGYGDFGKLRVTAAATLNGMLTVIAAPGFDPAPATLNQEILFADGGLLENLAFSLPPGWQPVIDADSIEIDN